MKIGIKAAGLLLATTFAGILMAGQLITAPAAHAAWGGGQGQDPITGVCWSQNNPSNSYGGSGNIPCMPGRLGLCMGALQNTPIPGATLPGANRNGSWP